MAQYELYRNKSYTWLRTNCIGTSELYMAQYELYTN